MIRVWEVLILVIVGVFVASIVRAGPYTWMEFDNFDLIQEKISSITEENCRSKPKGELRLENSTVAQVPKYNVLLSTIIYSNRSTLLHLHNMALNRAFYFSYIFQALNRSDDFPYQPGLMYFYMSTTADVSGSAGFINGSALYFDTNCSYPNYYGTTINFNTTLPLFGPRAWRSDDYNDPTNFLREPTNNTVKVHDYGAGRMSNYTSKEYKTNPWYDIWLPDIKKGAESLKKYTYTVGIKYSNTTGKFIKEEFDARKFFGPPQPGQSDEVSLPVKFSAPYFDCGRSNKWIVSATAPIVEYMTRYSEYTHLRRARYVGVVTQDIEFERIDINPCPLSEGNPIYNFFAGTDRCKKGTTMCEPLNGYGFRRGGYQCVCRPGYYYPVWHDGPYLGLEIEEATEDEYRIGFDCIPVEELHVWSVENPVFVERKKRSLKSSYKDRFFKTDSLSKRTKLRSKRSTVERINESSRKVERTVTREKRFIPRFEGEKKHIRHKREAFDEDAYIRMQDILKTKYKTNRANCGSKDPKELLLPGDVAYGVERQFEAQGRTALRLAHFLSNFLQNVDEYEDFGSIKGDRRLNETQIFGEVIANTMSDFRILGSGVFFDRYMFRMSPPINSSTDPRYTSGITREFFGPYSWRIQTDGDGLDEFRAIDYAGSQAGYVDKPWFRDMKGRWATNFEALKKYTEKPMIRSDPQGTSLVRFEHYHLTFKAPMYEHGRWLRPEFKCDGQVDDWVITYAVPFFGLDMLKTKLEFKGVVTVDVQLNYLTINQCPNDFHVANAFKNTARCHFQSTYCVPLEGLRFQKGGYKCECRQGYEYPFNDLAWYFDGQTMEEEYSKYTSEEGNRYEILKCRIAAASSVLASWVTIVTSLVLLGFFTEH